MTLEEGSSERFRWSAGLVPAGLFSASVQMPSGMYETELDTGPAGAREARIDVPPPALVSVSCIDGGSGARIARSHIELSSWQGRPNTPRQSFEGDTEHLRFHVPSGEILFRATAEGYEETARILTIGPGSNEIVLPLRRL